MLDSVIFYLHYLILLLFGVAMSFSLSDIPFSKKNLRTFVIFCTGSTMLQVICHIILQLPEAIIWNIYPFIIHVPIFILLHKHYHKRGSTAIAAISTSYLCCQPANILGVLSFQMLNNATIEYVVRIFALIATFFLIRKMCVPSLSSIFNRDNRSIYAFAILPVGYYIYDYALGIYTNLWYTHNEVAREFLPMFLFCIFLIFCFNYYKEYALREALERKEQLIAISFEQQHKELEAIRRSSKEIRLLRHDMRFILSTAVAHLENNDTTKALELMSEFSSHIDATVVKHYCANETFNYVITAYAAKCEQENIDFSCTAELGDTSYDDIMLSSILSNALDNAVNAQLELPEGKRRIKLMVKHSNDKLLISVKNPFYTKPVFVDGIPVSNRKGHGYGTQSIKYMTERLGGNCQFSIQDDIFSLRIVL